MTVPECIGCRDPEHGDVFVFCLVHGSCDGCANPQRGAIELGDLSRACPKHGVVAEQRRAEMLGRPGYARVAVAGGVSYDELPASEQTQARLKMEAGIASALSELNFTERLRSAGKPWAEVDEEGNLVMRDPRSPADQRP